MKTIKSLCKAMAVLMLVLLSSCGSYKKVPYMQNSREVDLENGALLYEARIMPKDELTVMVILPGSKEDRFAVEPFNLVRPTTQGEGGGGSSQDNYPTYIVRNDGTIDFPILGTLKVGGMTMRELEAMITSRLEGVYLKKHPVVIARMKNFKVSVLGEVNSPGSFQVTSEKINVFEALAQSGDLTVYGRRDNVKLIRMDENGKKTIHEIDLNDANLINSPYYYLQQNDVVYVTPNKVKAWGSEIGAPTSLLFSVIGIAMSLASLLATLLR